MKNLINNFTNKLFSTALRQHSNNLDELFENIKQLELHPGAPNGVFCTERWVYEAILDIPKSGETTLETGAGASSLCFARSQSLEHYILSPDPNDFHQLKKFSIQFNEPIEKLIFEKRSSVETLPDFNKTLGMALVDGCHGPFIPFIDFYYCVKNLKAGGHILIDDIHLFAPKVVFEFAIKEPTVEVVFRTKRAALLKVMDNSFIEKDWCDSGLPYMWEGELITNSILEKADRFNPAL